MKRRRNRAALEKAVQQSSPRSKGVALYELALFHDNNSREAEAIPVYQRATRTGLPANLRARALAWIASSLYKTAQPRKARLRLNQARAIAKDRVLLKFLDGLQRRIDLQHSA